MAEQRLDAGFLAGGLRGVSTGLWAVSADVAWTSFFGKKYLGSIRGVTFAVGTVGAAIGFITPPFGLNLFVASGITGIPYSKLLRFAVMYLGVLLVAWLLIAFVPWLSLALLPQRGG